MKFALDNTAESGDERKFLKSSRQVSVSVPSPSSKAGKTKTSPSSMKAKNSKLLQSNYYSEATSSRNRQVVAETSRSAGKADLGVIDLQLHRSVMITPRDDDDDFDDIDHVDGNLTFSNNRLQRFQDVRCELRATGGHNLTSVLMNPRESLYDEVFDEFSFELASPVDLSLSSSSHLSLLKDSKHGGLFTSSSNHSSHSVHMSVTSTPSGGSALKKRERAASVISSTTSTHSSSHHGAVRPGSSSSGGALHALTKTESEQLLAFIQVRLHPLM